MAVYLKCNYYWRDPCFTFMIMGRRVYHFMFYYHTIHRMQGTHLPSMDVYVFPIDRAQFISFFVFNVDWKKHVWRIKQCKSRVLLEWLFQSRTYKAFFRGVGKYLLMTPMWLVYLYIWFYLHIKESRSCKVNMIIWRMLRLCDYILILQIDTVCNIYIYII